MNKVSVSFEQWGATGVDSYLADESSVPALYKDPAGLNTYEKNLSAITVKWNEGASKEEKTGTYHYPEVDCELAVR